MTAVLYRPSLDARSGAGQLLAMQWRGLTRAGLAALVACDRGALKFWLRTGVRAHRRSVAELVRLQERGAVLVDHGLSLPSAEVVFVHNVAAETARHVPAALGRDAVQREQAFFRALRADAAVVANSKLVADALHGHFGVARERLHVLYPGYQSRRFSPQRASALRASARASLRLDDAAPLVGFVTSGDFAKRGLDLFLDCAARIAAERPDVRFLVVGSKRLPGEARAHALARNGTLHYRPKGRAPERWLAALDLFLYAARFEEFGMVVAEAQAMGVAVLTSRVVGAGECLPAEYAEWLLERPDAPLFAERALRLIGDDAQRRRLAAVAAVSVAAYDESAYVAGTQRLLEARTRG